MKKLAVFLMIPALAVFMVPALASANWYYWWGIQGTWGMSASGSCLHSEVDYSNTNPKNWWTAPEPSKVYAGVAVANGTWTFKAHGAGTYSQKIYATILPGGTDSMNTIPIPLQVRVMQPPSVVFTYEITPSGDITVTEANPDGTPNPNGLKHVGSISKNMNTMTLLTANNDQPLGGMFGYTICNFARTLIKVQE